jgi:hypothetical protein
MFSFANWFNPQPQRPLYFQPQQQYPQPQPKPQPKPQSKPEYFYYTIVDKNGDQTYKSSLLRILNNSYDVRKFDDVRETAIFNTGAVGNKIGRDAGKVMYAVRVDKDNSDLIMKYIESVSPLPDGWKQLRDPEDRVVYQKSENGTQQYERPPPLGWEVFKDNNGFDYYGNPALKIVQYEFPKCVLQPGWEVLRDPSGRVSYGNPALKKTQWERPCAPAPSVSANLPVPASPAPSVSANLPVPASPAPSVKYYVKVGDGDFPYVSASKSLEDAINSVCPTDNSTCHTEMVRANPTQQQEIEEYNAKIKNNNLNGGAKNKKKHRRTKRRNSHRSRRKSHRRRMI